MSLTQTYYIAASARSKLGKEASRPDHDLRLLVGHANLLDSLMIELADAEREQEAWFNQTVKRAQKAEERHIQWADAIVEDATEDAEEEMDDAASDSSSDSEFDEEDFQVIIPRRGVTTSPVTITTTELEEEETDEEDYYDEEDDDEHALTRTQSQSPPELIEDLESDEESPPTSPPQPAFEFTEEEREAIATTGFYGKSAQLQEEALLKDGYFIPARQAPLIASY